MRWRLLVLAASVLAAVAMLVVRTMSRADLLAVDSVASPVNRRTAPRPRMSKLQRLTSVAPRQAAPPLARPASLIGTDVDGQFSLGAGGATGDGPTFVASAGAVRVFDYFLSTLGEVDLIDVRELVRQHAMQELHDDESVAAVVALFDQYLEYLDGLQALAESAAGQREGSAAVAHLDRVESLQRDVFGPDTADAMFATDNAVARAVVLRSDLGPRDRYAGSDYDQRLAEVEAGLPPAVRSAVDRDRAVGRVRTAVEQLRAQGASASEIWRVRASEFGAAAADRLAELDRQRQSAAR